jgi:hypothetical protein
MGKSGKIVKMNQDDLRVILVNKRPHLSDAERMQPDSLIFQFQLENVPEDEDTEYHWTRIREAQRYWGKVIR